MWRSVGGQDSLPSKQGNRGAPSALGEAELHISISSISICALHKEETN